MSDDGGPYAPRPVTIESPLGVPEARARLGRVIADGGFTGGAGEADPGVRLAGYLEGDPRAKAATGDGAVRITGRGPRSIGLVTLAVATFQGSLEDTGSGSRLAGTISSPVSGGAWLVPAVAFVLAVVEGFGRNLGEAAMWLVLSVVLTATIRWSQRSARREEAQLERALALALGARGGAGDAERTA